MITFALMSMLLAQQQDPLLEWMNRQAQQQLDARDRTMAAIRTSVEADRRKAELNCCRSWAGCRTIEVRCARV